MLTETDKWLILVNYITIAKSSYIGFKILQFFIKQAFFKNYNTDVFKRSFSLYHNFF